LKEINFQDLAQARSDKKLRDNLHETKKALKLDTVERRAEDVLSPEQRKKKADIS